MDILAELREVYKQEWWHTVKIPDKELDKYHSKLLKQGNIFYIDRYTLVAYIEYWRITDGQLDEILINNSWSAYHNNITDGNISFVANIWIHPDYRGNKLIDNALKYMYIERSKGCKKLVWKRNRRGKPMKLFTYGGNDGKQ